MSISITQCVDMTLCGVQGWQTLAWGNQCQDHFDHWLWARKQFMALYLELCLMSSYASRSFCHYNMLQVLHLCRVGVPAQIGFFGLSGGGWQEGSTLVLTMHGAPLFQLL
eukprot:4401184-Amphidinium_carterae.1